MASIEITTFFEKREIGDPPQTVQVAVRPMTKQQAREAYPYRPFHPKFCESHWGGNNLVDDTVLLLSEKARRCEMCKAPTKNGHLINETCPDCDGRSEQNGIDPHEPKAG